MQNQTICDFKVTGYTMLNKLGEGQFGVVFKARNDITKKEFAIKGLKKQKINSSEKLKELFETEVAIMQKINHPNILHCYEKLEDGNYYYLVLDYCNSGDLEQHLKTKCPNGRIKESEAIYFLKQMMNGLAELHNRKIMHRDFKPANVFLHNDNVVIGDFGFAKSGTELTTTSVGTPLFKAPELHRSQGIRNYSNKVDIFALSMTFYHMLFGGMPWVPKTFPELQNFAENKTGVNLPFAPEVHISEKSRDFLMKASDPDPEKRPSLEVLFRHDLFRQEMGDFESSAHRSVMFFGNKLIADRMFEENREREEDAKLQEFIDILSLDKEELAKMLNYPSSQNMGIEQSRKQQEDYQPILDRIYHEKQVSYFMFCCSQELLALDQWIPNNAKLVADIAAIIALLIAKKSTCINQAMIKQIFEGVNTFKLPAFDEFVKSNACEKILEELLQDNSVLGDLLDNLRLEVENKIEYSTDENSQSLGLVKIDSPSIEEIDEALSRNIGTLLMFKDSLGEITGEKRDLLEKALAKASISKDHSRYLPYQTESRGTFDWNTFERIFREAGSTSDLVLARANDFIF